MRLFIDLSTTQPKKKKKIQKDKEKMGDILLPLKHSNRDSERSHKLK